MTPIATARKLIFVIDDEQVIARTLAIILQRAGYRTEFYSSAEQALAASSVRPPDLIVSDVVMDGMNGIEFAQTISNTHPGMPLILISGQAATSQLIEQARARGQHVIVHPKPILPEFLLNEVARLLNPAGQSAPQDLAA